MGQSETPLDQRKRFSQIWITSRQDAGKTQDFIAKGLGVSKKTIQNWESGATSPDFFMGSEWFRVLGLNPIPYYLSFLFPSLFENISQEEDDALIDHTLLSLIQNSTAIEKRQLLFLMAGHHGGSWYSLLQMFTAHCHNSMQSRVTVARNIVDHYEMEKAAGKLVCPDSVQPDLQLLKAAIEEGKRAAITGNKGYAHTDPNHKKEH